MTIGDELQHAVYTYNILSMQDDHIIIFNFHILFTVKIKSQFYQVNNRETKVEASLKYTSKHATKDH